MHCNFKISGEKFLHTIVLITVSFIFINPVAIAQTGKTWTSRTSIDNNFWTSVAYGKGKFVAVGSLGSSNIMMTSPDGVTWTSRPALPGGWRSVAYGNNIFVAVSSGGANQVMTSPDGITWTNRTPASNNTWQSVAYGNGTFVAVADNGALNQVMTSTDGINWTSQTAVTANFWTSVTYGNDRFVAVAYSGKGTANQVMTSPDGVTWSGHTSTADNDWRSVTYGNGLFVVVAQNGLGDLVMTSLDDGVTWNNHVSPSKFWTSVTYGNGLFVAVANGGTGNRVMTSPDGVNWASRTSAADNVWNSVTYANGMFVAVASTGTLNRVMTSGTFTALPLKWLSTAGYLNNAEQAAIKWSVAEQAVADYQIEKSIDGINYSTIGSISSKGDGENNYEFTEQQPLTTAAWYRIKQTDIDGKFSYSSVVILRNNDHYQKSVYPNPVEEQVTILVDKKLLNKNAVITDMQGKTLQTLKINALSFTVNIANYPAGCYLLKIENESPVKIMKK